MNSLEILKELVSIPSVNPFRYFYPDSLTREEALGLGSEGPINEAIESMLKSAGFEVSRQYLHHKHTIQSGGKTIELPARWNILGEKRPTTGSSDHSILFLGHTDTVDVKNGWDSDPFTIQSKVVNGSERWYGLGANDMKGGLAAIIGAAFAASSPRRAVKVAFVVDEEYYSFGAEALLRSNFLDDVELAVVPEIGDGINTLDEQWIGLGRLGRTEYEFQITGKACHGADAFVREDSVNAVHEAVMLEAQLVQHCRDSRRVFRQHGIEAINAAYLSHHTGGEAMLSVPDRAAVVLDRTFLPDESPEHELAELQTLVKNLQSTGKVDPRAQISVYERPRPTPPCKPYFFAPDLPVIKRVSDLVAKHAARLTYGIGRSVADENRIALRGIPTVILGPTGAGSHTNQEWVDPASVVRLTSIFKDLMIAA